MLKLSERLYSLRKERKLTQDSVAKELGISMKSYCRYEKNEREPTASLLVEMAMLYHVSWTIWLG